MTEKFKNLSNKFWDVLIVGAGPAGLFTALELASKTNLEILLIDSGHDIDDRHRQLLQQNQIQEEQDNYISGIGGAGLYSDGKLCFSLEVGGQLSESLTPERKQALLSKIADYFGLILEFNELEIAKKVDINKTKEIAKKAGLNFKYYPVLSIGTERCSDLILQIKNTLIAKGVNLIPRCELLDVCADNQEEFKVALVKKGEESHTIRAKNVVLAMGKVGADIESKICTKLDVNVSSKALYIGVRLETDSGNIERFFSISKDPKFNIGFLDGSKIKTHCASNNGQILALSYDGLPMAGGHNFNSFKTGRSGFSILWDGIEIGDSGYKTAKKIMSSIKSYTNGSLLIQTLNDFLANKPSNENSFRKINLSNTICKAGNIRDFLPEEYFHKFEIFINRLSRIEPKILSPNTVLYAPAIEWWMNKVEIINENMETKCKGVYVCGDGSGWSQGIVHSAATGILVAEGIVKAMANHTKRRKLELIGNF